MCDPVTGDAAPSRSDQLAALRRLSLRVREGDPPAALEIERALEAGFGAMIGLEAELSRLRSRSLPADDVSTGRPGAVELQSQIEEFREALTDLRTLAAPSEESRVGYGFVLPATRRHTHN